MSWQEYQNNDRLEQERLDVCRALIEDATRDTTLWLQSDPSAEERVHVLAIQAQLAGLARIIERRMERRNETKDEWEYSETVGELLSRLDKAREVRGSIVGKGLARVADRLPKELPSSKVTKAPKPQSTSIIPGQFEGLPASHFPSPHTAKPPETSNPYFSDSWSRPLDQGASWKDFQERFMQLAREEQGRADAITKWKALSSMNQVLRASCSYKEHPVGWEKGKPEQGCICLLETPPHGVWNYCSDGISENFFERVRLCVAEAGHALPDYPKDMDPEDFWLHRLYLDLRKNNSDLLFAAHEEGGMILSVCVASATFCARLDRKAIAGADGLRTGEKQAESFRAQNSDKTAQSVQSHSADRRAMIDAYIAKVLAITGKKISRKEFWLVAGYNSPTEFERFQRDDPRTTQSAVANFKRVLDLKPEDFIRSLGKRKPTKSAQAKTTG
jgi:hypothetical protein